MSQVEDIVGQAETKEKKKTKSWNYNKEMRRLHIELAHLQAWVKDSGLRVVIIFEGRDAAGKGGIIKRILEKVSPRVFRVVALPAPTDREKSQIYMQRYIAHLPAAGEIVIFDRSWYNRPGVDRIMGFCSEKKARRFLELAPRFEAAIVESGVLLLKYFLIVSENEQERRFRKRIEDPLRQWKLSPMDVESYRRWWDYTQAYDEMLRMTDPARAVVDRPVGRQEAGARQLHCPYSLVHSLRTYHVQGARPRQAPETAECLCRGPEPPTCRARYHAIGAWRGLKRRQP